MTSIHVSLSVEMKKRLGVECQRLGLSMAAYVRLSMAAYVRLVLAEKLREG
ncbi:hypothetical protein ACJBSH_09375 [Streptococcus suis]|uniref:hypothetical protein n=1 Tax=Streptococcus suis TaxID=1307 RepID=UPI000B55C513|nr:hypothetical protein [Streptococcus suis]ANM47420.1 hypothetical protein [Streptococcus phage phiLP081102]MBS0802015.1 hypothetical protein [Streptococcus suis]MCH1653054.1 hypothetical protein [Streptococcus suis]MCH1659001.1 hypothetical protein [Streptococcus suis]MCH1665693.1 hypothetical protein [Streptococcus suis]